MPAAPSIVIPTIALSSSSLLLLTSRTFFLRSSPPHAALSRRFALSCSSICRSAMPQNQKSRGFKQQRWKQKPTSDGSSQANAASSGATSGHCGLNTDQTSRHVRVQNPPVLRENQVPAQGAKAIWKPKSYGTSSGSASLGVDSEPVDKMIVDGEQNSAALSKLFTGSLLEKFTPDNSSYSHAQIRATFYPKFENEKSDQEVRTRMIEIVSNGLGALEVSLKHSGSLFMYAGHKGGAYAKNSYGNIYTAVGVFVLGRMFREAWGTKAAKKQASFNKFLERNRMCISMELVTAVLGDHGQRPRDDYAVVTAVAELGNGKPKFYSTPEIIAFCRKWRLTTNHVWLFSKRKSVTSFFAAFDALCEEGIASSVCRTLDEIADISVPGSKDHTKVQGEILEGLVARIVTHKSSKHMEEVLRDLPPPPADGAALDLGSSLREICRANKSNEMQQIKALLQNVGSSFCPDFSDWFGTETGEGHSRNADQSVLSKFLQGRPADYSTTKVQEMLRLMKEKRFPATFKCYHNFQKVELVSDDNLFYKMVIHVRSDSAFRRYHKEMRAKPELWPLYRGFFVDINLFKANKDRAAEIESSNSSAVHKVSSVDSSSENEDFANDDANLMIKLKFLTYKLRTFLIRNGLSVLFKSGPAAYKAYYLRQMNIWGTSAGKKRELSKMLDEWAVYIRRKYGNKPLSSSTYLSEAEPFLEQYANRSPENQALIGSAGNLVRAEDFLAIVEGGRDEEGDLEMELEVPTSTPNPSISDIATKPEGLIVFFPGIPGCAKSGLCKELLNTPGGLGDDRPIYSLMGDLVKGKYWQKIADDRRKRPNSIMLADKNAPNEEVWGQIENMCHGTKARAVPVVPDSEGTDSNPFSLDALAIFMFRVLQRVNHPGNLDKASPNAGYVLLMFYHLYEGKSRGEFDTELVERFGSLVKMPLLESDRGPLPEPVRSVLEEGINLYRLHTSKHGRADPSKGSYAKEWVKWEKQLREVLFGNTEYLKSVQVPFNVAVKHVLDELRKIANGEYVMPSTQKRRFGTIIYAAVSLPVSEIGSFLDSLAVKNPTIKAFIKNKNIGSKLKQAHVTLAHKRSHGVTTVASYGVYQNRQVPVEITALLFSDKMAAFEARLGSVDEEQINSKNEWPHVTLWMGDGVAAREANMLPQLVSEGKASRIDIIPPTTIHGTLDFF